MSGKNHLVLLTLLFTLFALNSIYGQESAKEKDAKMISGFSSEFLGQVDFVRGRLVDLHKAFPKDKFSWRPEKGIRSVAQVFLHAAMANYYFGKISGYGIPKDIDIEMGPQKWDQMTENKDEISKILERSFTDLLAVGKKITEKDLEKQVHAFGMDMTLRNFMVTSLNHLHEHLGQAIAYARSNGVTPPWSVKKNK